MSLMHYLLEANLYMAAFYVLYLILLRSETHYQLNRAYLLITSLLSFIIPVIQLGILRPATEPIASISVGSMEGSFAVIAEPVVLAQKWSVNDYILLGWGIVAFVLLVNLLIRIYLLVALSKKGKIKENQGYKIVELHQGSVAFSFFNNLFIDDRLAGSQTILHHEQVHIRQKHSWDIIYLEVLKIINWFNPVIYLLIASIKELHEFIADEQTAGLENNNDSYTDFLISNAYGITQNSLTNSFFNKNLLKRRITMLYQKKSGRAARLKYLLAVPLICGLLCLSTLAFTTKTYAFVDLAPKHNNAVDAAIPTSGNTEPSYPGGNQAFYKFLKSHIDHNKTKADGNIENHLTAMFTVEKDGSLSHIIINRSPNGLFTEASWEEIVFALRDSPKWLPGTRNGKTASLKHFVIFDFDKEPATWASKTDEYSKGFKAAVDEANQKAPADTSKKVKVTNVVLPPPPRATKSKIKKYPPPVVVSDMIFTAVEQNPEFPGGDAEFGKFLQKNIHYPAVDKKNNIQGKVYITFVVEADGHLSNEKVVRTPSESLGKEALRVIKLSPKWKPGVQNGKKVRVQYTIPVNFAMDDANPNKTTQIKFPPPVPSSRMVNGKTVYTTVDRAPEYPGGVAAFGQFLAKNMHCPADDKNKGIEGKVIVGFIVGIDGALSDIVVKHSPSAAMSAEALRVLKLSPKWIAGEQNGKKVRVQYFVPVNFSLSVANQAVKPKKEVFAAPASANPKPIYVVGYGGKAAKHDSGQYRFPPPVVVPDKPLATLTGGTLPQFEGGEAAFGKFLQQKIHYPTVDKVNNVQGKVYIKVTVQEDGSLSNLMVTQTPSKTLAAEVKRVMALSPKWTPAQKDGKPVAVEYTVPVTFSLGD
jgi:TonB family protein